MTDKLERLLSTTLAFDRLTRGGDDVLSYEQVECLKGHLATFGDVLARKELLRYMKGLMRSHENMRSEKIVNQLLEDV